tara:strand:- start:803 stop:1252 length:450 start_codon:yes stop_codon:yes gene_type:complete
MSSFDIFRRLESSDDNQEALRQEVKTYKAAGAITAGDFLELDASKTGATRALYVKKCTTVATVGNGGVIGVALESAAAADDDIRVVTRGYVASAFVNASTAIGSILCGPITSGGAAGRADLATAATLGGIAVALEADTANYAAIWLFAR